MYTVFYFQTFETLFDNCSSCLFIVLLCLKSFTAQYSYTQSYAATRFQMQSSFRLKVTKNKPIYGLLYALLAIEQLPMVSRLSQGDCLQRHC